MDCIEVQQMKAQAREEKARKKVGLLSIYLQNEQRETVRGYGLGVSCESAAIVHINL